MPAQTVKTQKSSKEATVKKPEEKHPVTQEISTPITNLQRAVADPVAARPPEVLALQRKYGNEAVQRLLIDHNLQAKLTVGAANDSYEQEADHVAAQVMSAPDVQRQPEEEELQTKPLAATITPLIQRQPIPEEEEEPLQGKFIQRQGIPEEEEEEPLQGKFTPSRETFAPGTDFESRLAAMRAGGGPLPKSTREFMEQRFGADFGGVHLHTGSESAQLNREISAEAFTRGQDIYLGEGKEDVESSAGKQLLAHELTHVIQQNGSKAQKSSSAPLQRKAVPGVAGLGKFTDVGDGLFASTTPVSAKDVSDLVKRIQTVREKVDTKILTGTHGSPEGHLVGEPIFYKEDLANEGVRPEGGWVNVISVRHKDKAAIGGLWQHRPRSAVILAWCYSQMSVNNWNTLHAFWDKDPTTGQLKKDW
jgi:hypothetical protein